MDISEFRKQAHTLVDWIADYFENVDKYPVKSQVKPKEVFAKLPDTPPEIAEEMKDIFEDFREIILPGVTHWQSPNFFAYFPANSSYPISPWRNGYRCIGCPVHEMGNLAGRD